MVQQWVEFVKNFEELLMSNRLGENTKVQGGNDSQFMTNISNAIKDSKIFQIGEHSKKLLMLTTPPNKNEKIRMPFPSIFVDANFTKEECANFGWKVEGDIVGFIVQESDLMTNLNFEVVVGRTIRLIVCIKKDGYIEFNTFNLEMSVDEDFKDSKIEMVNPINMKAKRFLHTFTINLINLVNDPEIELVSRDEDVDRNNKRAKRGKCKIPSTTIIRLDEKRKIYVDGLVAGGHLEMGSGYAWFVRGHWRELKAERYKQNVGKKMWIMPYVKNQEGILIKKDYMVGE